VIFVGRQLAVSIEALFRVSATYWRLKEIVSIRFNNRAKGLEKSKCIL